MGCSKSSGSRSGGQALSVVGRRSWVCGTCVTAKNAANNSYACKTAVAFQCELW